ncbi:hypothetical protein [Dyella sp.]|uniref:hypothetical protein n=1 Tax=Dyella sp. TaxID=1869338 RepID=UPI002ED66CB5
MTKLWQLATEHASQAIAGRFAKEQAELDIDRGALAVERGDWTVRVDSNETARQGSR